MSTITTTAPPPAPADAETTAPEKARPLKYSQVRYEPLPSVANARMIKDRHFASAVKQIREYAERFGVAEPSIVDGEQLAENFRHFATMMLVHFAKKVLSAGDGAAGVGKWSSLQAARVRAPFATYGAWTDAEHEQFDLRTEEGVARFRDAILVGDPEFEYLTAPHGARFFQDSTHLVTTGIPGGLGGPDGVQAALVTMASVSSNICVQERPETARELREAPGRSPVDYSGPVRCCLTGREMAPEDRVLRARIEIDSLSPPPPGAAEREGEGEGAEMAHEIVVDYAPLSERLAPGAAPLPPYLADSRVSDLVLVILNYSAMEGWLVGLYNAHIQQICEYAEGNISSEVLEEQRKKIAARRQSKGAVKNTVVLKVNKPMQIEKWFEAFELGTFTGYAIEILNNIYIQYKKLQVHFLVACQYIREIQRQRS